MKKKILSLIFAICLISSAMFCLTACKDGENPPAPNTYLVQFYNHDGSLIKETNVEENSVATCATPTKAPTQHYIYEFLNWALLDGTDATEDLTNVTQNLTVKAVFIEVQPTYTLTFYDEDRQTVIETMSVLRGEDATLPAAEAKTTEYFHLSFNCWVGKHNGIYNDEIINVASDMEFVAKYDIVDQHAGYPVEFYDEDGETLLATINIFSGDYLSEYDTPTYGKVIDEWVNEYNCNIKFCHEISGWRDEFGNEVGERRDELDIREGSKFYAINSNVVVGVETFYDRYRSVFSFRLSEDKAYYTLTGTFVNTLYDGLRIPSAINSIPITHLSFGFGIEPDSSGVVYIPEGITTIDEKTTCGSNTKKLVLPSTLKYVYDDKFVDCLYLEEVNFLGDINDWVQVDFRSEFSTYVESFKFKINGESPTSANLTTATIIKANTLKYLDLDSIEISNLLQTCEDYVRIPEVNFVGDINDWASRPYGGLYCDVLKINGEVVTNVKIDKATSISPRAFSGIGSIIAVELGETVESIGERAFYNMENLLYIVLSENIKEIKDDAFYNCSGLDRVVFLGDINDWVSISFEDHNSNPLRNGANLIINGINVTSADITTAIKINHYVFSGYKLLSSVTIGESVKDIGVGVFGGCENLTTVTIDSEAIVNDFFPLSAMTTIYIKTEIDIANSTELLENYTKQVTSDKAGYDMYVRNVTES